MKFSLILGTIGKVEELSNFLHHLNQQTFKSFELILVDQSHDDRLAPLLAEYHDHLSIVHLRSEIGISRARNDGIPIAGGDLIGFPDDDCWYTADLLERVSKYFQDQPNIDGILGRIIDSEGDNSTKFASQPGKILKLNVWERANTNSMFLRSNVVRDVGDFDENLGPGAPTGLYSSDDVDYAIRCVEKGYDLYYDPDITVFHPNTYNKDYEFLSKRAYSYGAGMGYSWKKHNYPFWFVFYYLIRALGGSILFILQGNQIRSKYHWLNFRGRWYGWWSSAQ